MRALRGNVATDVGVSWIFVYGVIPIFDMVDGGLSIILIRGKCGAYLELVCLA